MAFDYPEGFKVTRDEGIKRPKGVPKKRRQKASRQPIRGDLRTDDKLEAAMWVTPRYNGRHR